MDDLKRLLNHLEGRVTATAEIPSPFSAAVREAQLPTEYRNTTSDLYFHGSSNPVKFLGRFNIEMSVYQVPDLARCQLLEATFRESTRQWFQKLGPGVITSWDQMKIPFLIKFQPAVRYASSVTTLANVKQRENESLTSYFKWFNAEYTSVRESFKAIELSLAEVQPTSQTSQRGRARKRDRSLSSRYRISSRILSRVNATTVRREWSPPSSYDSRMSGYTPLAMSIEHIFESKDKKKYYEYHESSGHNTHECQQRNDEIKILIKEGYLGEWVVKEVRRHKSSADKAKEEGGRTPRGSTTKLWKKISLSGIAASEQYTEDILGWIAVTELWQGMKGMPSADH
ncbi:uncharacterized protein LOC141714725 [Apium graveolens]|uniref:uncharacterized protein LOC141714725 n=1 Tax=Apium graveolens TaxID=4045 RepID=UPI003D79A44D